jgi:hypothetical protein
MITHVIRDIPIELDAEMIVRRQGLMPGSSRAARLAKAAAEALADALPLIRPQATYALVPIVKWSIDRVQLADQHEFHGLPIAEHLQGSEEVAVAIYTIGDALESMATDLYQQDAVRSIMLEAAGNAALTQISTWLCAEVDAYAGTHGLDVSSPIQPGQIGWRLEDQDEVFSILDGGRIGVTLTNSYTMLPLKSESVAIGVGKPTAAGHSCTCERCDLRSRCQNRHPAQ